MTSPTVVTFLWKQKQKQSLALACQNVGEVQADTNTFLQWWMNEHADVVELRDLTRYEHFKKNVERPASFNTEHFCKPSQSGDDDVLHLQWIWQEMFMISKLFSFLIQRSCLFPFLIHNTRMTDTRITGVNFFSQQKQLIWFKKKKKSGSEREKKNTLNLSSFYFIKALTISVNFYYIFSYHSRHVLTFGIKIN